MVKESTHGKMEINTMDYGRMTKNMAKVNNNGIVATDTKDNGWMVICMDKESTNGKMEINTMDN